jgi:hypothetical protein
MNERIKANLFLMRSSPFVLVKWFHMNRQATICWRRSELDSSCGACKIWILIMPCCAVFDATETSSRFTYVPILENNIACPCSKMTASSPFCVSWLFYWYCTGSGSRDRLVCVAPTTESSWISHVPCLKNCLWQWWREEFLDKILS